MKMFKFFVTIIFLAIWNLCPAQNTQLLDNGTVKVDIAQGTLKGLSLTTVMGVPYYSFRGVPYAQPPVGELRFKAPQPPLPWDGVRDASKEGDICPQTLSLYFPNEDCLFLNIYTTQLPSDTDSPNLSVMFWIHGGPFVEGSGNTDSYGPDYLIDKNVILVTINYRLGILGFLGLHHPEVSKNNGLKDQVAALRWVHNNIDKFGGNPDDVTIFGESAGGASVHYQLLSPLSEGLFHKAICQSGSVLDGWAFIEPTKAHKNALAAGHILSPNSNDVSDILETLMTATPAELIIASTSIPKSLSDAFLIQFAPTKEDVEDAFLPESPVTLIKTGKFHQVPFITGANSAEGKLFAIDVYTMPYLYEYYEENFEEMFVPSQLNLVKGSPESLAAAARIKEAYFGDKTLSIYTLPQYVDLLTDLVIVTGIRRAIDLQRITGTSPVYSYIFSYFGRLNIFQYYVNYTFPGAAHIDELGYLFRIPTLTVDGDSLEAKTIQRMTTLWTNFAKTGTPSLDEDYIFWRSLNEESNTYLNIDAELSLKDYKEYKPEKMALWTDLFKTIDEL